MCNCNNDDYARGYNEGYERARRDMIAILDERAAGHVVDGIGGSTITLGRYRESVELKSMISKEV